MSKLPVILMAGALAVTSSYVFGQAAAPPMTPKDRGSAAAYQNPAAEKTQAEKAREGMSTVEKSKADAKAVKPDVKDPDTLKRAQALSASGTNQEEAKANVAKSQGSGPRAKMPNIKDLTPEQRNELRRQLQEQSKP